MNKIEIAEDKIKPIIFRTFSSLYDVFGSSINLKRRSTDVNLLFL